MPQAFLVVGGIVVLSLAAACVGMLIVVPMRLELIQPWSFALGQVAFGLTAAFLAIILPQLAQCHEWWDIWGTRVPEIEPKVDEQVFVTLINLVKQPQVQTRLQSIRHTILTKKLEEWSKKGRDDHLMHLIYCVGMIGTLIRRRAIWEGILRAGNLYDDQHVGIKTQFREKYIAELYIFDLRRLYTRMCADTISLCVISLCLGLFSLSPDPFYYGFITCRHLQKDPQLAEISYPMFVLLLPAMVTLCAMALLGFRVATTYGKLRRLDPHPFDLDFQTFTIGFEDLSRTEISKGAKM